jgi:hypothetical protein
MVQHRSPKAAFLKVRILHGELVLFQVGSSMLQSVMFWGKAHADRVAQEACERIEAIMDVNKTSPKKSKK